MAKRRLATVVALRPVADTAVLPDGRRLESGREIKIEGEPGSFRFVYVWEPDGSLVCWGPLDSQHAQWRSFRPSRVKRVHRKAQSRAARLAVEA